VLEAGEVVAAQGLPFDDREDASTKVSLEAWVG
jgi:hypothetical protein